MFTPKLLGEMYETADKYPIWFYTYWGTILIVLVMIVFFLKKSDGREKPTIKMEQKK